MADDDHASTMPSVCRLCGCITVAGLKASFLIFPSALGGVSVLYVVGLCDAVAMVTRFAPRMVLLSDHLVVHVPLYEILTRLSTLSQSYMGSCCGACSNVLLMQDW